MPFSLSIFRSKQTSSSGSDSANGKDISIQRYTQPSRSRFNLPWFRKRPRLDSIDNVDTMLTSRPLTPTPALLSTISSAKNTRSNLSNIYLPLSANKSRFMEDDTENRADDCDTEDHHHENVGNMNIMNKDSLSDDERIQLTSFAHGLRGLIAELQRADEEARTVPPMTNADGTPLSPITEADELPLEAEDDSLPLINADSSFDSELSGETIANPPTPISENISVLQHLRNYPIKNTRTRSISLQSGNAMHPEDAASDYDCDSASISTGLEPDEQLDDLEQVYFTAESNSAPSLPSFSGEDTESEHMERLIPELEDFHASRAATPIPFQMDRHIDACDDQTEIGSESESTTGSESDLLGDELSTAFPPKQQVISPRFRAASFATSREDLNLRSHFRSASGDTTGRKATTEMNANWQGYDSLRRIVADLQHEKAQLENALEGAERTIDEQSAALATLTNQISSLRSALFRLAQADFDASTLFPPTSPVPRIVTMPCDDLELDQDTRNLIASTNTLSTPPSTPDRDPETFIRSLTPTPRVVSLQPYVRTELTRRKSTGAASTISSRLRSREVCGRKVERESWWRDSVEIEEDDESEWRDSGIGFGRPQMRRRTGSVDLKSVKTWA